MTMHPIMAQALRPITDQLGPRHTPGPWSAEHTIDAHDGHPDVWQINAEYDAVCTTQFCYARGTAANAQLIAAAPELLEALEAAYTFISQPQAMHTPAGGPKTATYRIEGYNALTAKLRAAIAKATAQ